MKITLRTFQITAMLFSMLKRNATYEKLGVKNINLFRAKTEGVCPAPEKEKKGNK